jgi:hypothetical protein
MCPIWTDTRLPPPNRCPCLGELSVARVKPAGQQVVAAFPRLELAKLEPIHAVSESCCR